MTNIVESKFPLCAFFLSRYLSCNKIDEENFPADGGEDLLARYEKIFEAGVFNFGLSKEKLKSRSEFNFDSGNPTTLEAGIAIFRVAELLRIRGFRAIEMICPERGAQGADIVCEMNGIRVCVEVKTITKQSKGRQNFFLEEQLYQKAREVATKAAAQLKASAMMLNCNVNILAYVVNWFDHTIYLTQDDFQKIVNNLEQDGEVRSLDGIDGVWFIMRFGNDQLFLNEKGKCIDVLPDHK